MKSTLVAVCGLLFISIAAFASPDIKEAYSPKKKWLQDRTVTGKVTGDDGEALGNVTVQVKGTNRSTITGVDGSFSITIPSSGAVLVFSYVGMVTQEVPVTQRSSYQVTLSGSAGKLTDVVVVGYGTQRKANLTGSVATVSGQTLTERPAPNAANLLQGRVTGLQVTQSSSEPGRDNPNFLIRGRGSFSGGTNNAPLILIDGVTGSFNNLAPDDIENVTVLKDAASASIYGSRAANGVILVTTKKGKRGRTAVNYSANIARHTATALPDFITNSAEYMQMFNMAAARSGVAFRYPAADIQKYRDSSGAQYPSFDNVDHYFNPATVTNHNLSISGGTDKSTFNLSLSYLDQEALLPGYDFNRYNVLLNYSNQVSNAITVGTIMNLTYKDRKEPPFTSENLSLAVYAAGPLYGPFLPDGSGRVVSRAYQNEGRNRNPQEYYEMGNQNTKEYNLNAQAYVDVKLLKGLTWSSKVALNYVDEFYKMHQVPYSAYLLQEKDPATGDYRMSTFGPDVLGVTDQYAKAITPTAYSTLNYEKNFGDNHVIRALAGYEQVSYKYQTLRGRRTSTVAPVLTELTGYSATGESLFFTFPRLPGLSGPTEWALQSFFGRVNYSFKNKYLIEGNIRYDGSSRFSPEYRWGVFPSVSAGWVVSQEDFLRDKFNWLSFLKIRGSYGVLGNQDVGNYLYQPNLTISPVYPFGNTTPQQGAVINNFRDQSLQWESTSMLDVGLDVSIKRGLLGITFDWFRKTTYDILATQQIPASVGLGNPTLNDGKMRNQGIELELTHQNTIGALRYGANFLISTAKNKLLYINTPSKGTTINEIGLPYGSHYLYEWIGIFQVEDTVAGKTPRHALNPNPRPGDLMMKDQDGDGDVDANDRIVVNGVYPDYNYSFGFNIGIKGFDLSTFFQGVQGIAHRVNNWGIDPFFQGTAPTTKWRNAWTPQNRSNTLPAIYAGSYTGVTAYTGSTYYLQNASYFRLKNINLTYTFPRSVSQKLRADNLAVYVSADNVFTITRYEGSDPERTSSTGNYVQYPQARIINLGVNVKF